MTLPEARTWSERCSGCGYHPETQGCACNGTLRFTPGVREKAAGIARVEAAADPDLRAMVDEEIRRAAASGRVFSANDFRAQLPDDVGPLMGARFNAAAKAGLIVHVGFTPSTKASTNAHRVMTWRAA